MSKPKAVPDVKTLEEVTREHVLAVKAAYPDTPDYVLAVGLGISPSTLSRMLSELAGEEDVVRDRR